MNKLKIAFDVDGTLIHLEAYPGITPDTPRYDIIQLFKLFEGFGCEMYIWSGGGVGYAQRWKEKLGLNAKVVAKGSIQVDIAVDDMDTNLGLVDLVVNYNLNRKKK